MNIGLVTQWFASGAGHVSRAYEQVLETKHRVFVYARGGKVMKGHPMWDRPNVTWAPYHPCSTGIHRSHFAKWVKRNGIEVLFYNEQRYWDGVVLARKLDVLCGTYVDYYTQDTVPLFWLFDFLVCNTRRHYSVFNNHPQSCYVPWGTDIHTYMPSRRPPRPLTFMISAGWDGRFAKQRTWMDRRGAGRVMQAFRSLQGDCRLLILSQVPLEQCPRAWQEHVAADHRIEFRVGTFEPTPYDDGDVYVYPSRLDGIGLTLPEALSSGMPAITTDCAPMNEFVRHGFNGLLVPVQEYRGRPDGYYWAEAICDVKELLRSMQTYVQAPALVMKHAHNAKADALEKLNWMENSKDLGTWIGKCGRLKPLINGLNEEALCKAAAIYDRANSPTPAIRAAIALKAMFVQYPRILRSSL